MPNCLVLTTENKK